MGLMEGRVALITGAGRGIGRATALLFAREGAAVGVNDLDPEVAAAVVAEIEAMGGRALAVPGDVTDPAFPARAADRVEEAWGPIDVLVNNAGYTWDAMAHKMTDEQWEAMLAVHATAAFRLCREVGGRMRARAKALLEAGQTPPLRQIVNVSSMSAWGNPGQANYAAAKAAVVGLTRTLAREWGPFNILVNAVAFGWVETRLTAPKEAGESFDPEGRIRLGIPEKFRQGLRHLIPLGRPAQPEEAARAILFLASPWASYITGQVLHVNGGALTV